MPTNGWYRGDCHVHSRASHGGELTPAELAAAARAAGLDFVGVTEHNSAGTHAEWQRLAGDDLVVILGQEVVTETGHWLALGVRPGQVVDWRYGVRHDRIGDAVAAVRRAGGLCVAAHPHAPYPSGTLGYPLETFDAVEVWNGRWRSDLPWNADNDAALAEWGRALAAGVHAGRWLPAIGNSDAHLRGQLGTPVTVVRAADPAGVPAGIRAGRCLIAESAGVGLEVTARAGGRTAGIGEVLDTGGGPAAIRVELSGVPDGTVSFHTDRGRMHVGPEWSTDAGESAYVRVEVRHPDGRMAALTNPIVLQAAGAASPG